jgi:hypothetical protein
MANSVRGATGSRRTQGCRAANGAPVLLRPGLFDNRRQGLGRASLHPVGRLHVMTASNRCCARLARLSVSSASTFLSDAMMRSSWLSSAGIFVAFHARPQSFHQIDDIRRLGGFCLFNLLAMRLPLNQVL